jgi:PilZ domain
MTMLYPPICFSHKRGPITTHDSTSRSLERRSAHRYAIFADAYFAWQEGEGQYSRGIGSTRNISDRGAFIQAVRIPPVGSGISVVLILPSIRGYTPKKSQLRGRGTVVRVVVSEGFVVEVSFRILRAEPIDVNSDFGLFC